MLWSGVISLQPGKAALLKNYLHVTFFVAEININQYNTIAPCLCLSHLLRCFFGADEEDAKPSCFVWMNLKPSGASGSKKRLLCVCVFGLLLV